MHLGQPGDLAHGFALLHQLAAKHCLARRQSRWAAKPHALLPRGDLSGAGAVQDQRARTTRCRRTTTG
jgi:hypothetical protein